MNDRKTDELVLFAKVVRSHRIALGFSQEELAARANLHRTYIGSVERGERNISLKNIYRLATALKTTPGALFRQVDDLLARR
jgi:transcriptional regulator with XRE-family HTH domain